MSSSRPFTRVAPLTPMYNVCECGYATILSRQRSFWGAHGVGHRGWGHVAADMRCSCHPKSPSLEESFTFSQLAYRVHPDTHALACPLLRLHGEILPLRLNPTSVKQCWKPHHPWHPAVLPSRACYHTLPCLYLHRAGIDFTMSELGNHTWNC